MSKVFISYRREDSQAWTGRLCDHIEQKFQPEQIFMDIDMEPGVDFVEAIEAAVQSCDVLVAVIGRLWLSVKDETGRRRIDHEQDFVRLEIATALRRDIRVIPCLVEGARMPQASQLPDDLVGLTRRQAVNLTHESFRHDAARLTAAIERILSRKLPAPSNLGQVKLHPIDGLEYVWIPPGTFWMGAVPGDMAAHFNEKPRHRVTLTRGFWLGRTTVTAAAYKRFSRKLSEPRDFNVDSERDDHPVVNVSWNNAQAYCAWAGCRLPTEAEWEYAARGGAEGKKFPWGDEIDETKANYGGNLKRTSAVGKYPPTGFNLFDMAGNVWEWTADWFAEYGGEEQTDPAGPESEDFRTIRGGSWSDFPTHLRCADRFWVHPDVRSSGLGFRVVRDAFP